MRISVSSKVVIGLLVALAVLPFSVFSWNLIEKLAGDAAVLVYWAVVAVGPFLIASALLVKAFKGKVG